MQGIRHVYLAMVDEELTLKVASKIFDTPLSTLRYHLVKYCKENGLKMPKRPQGRRLKRQEITRKYDYSDIC